MSTQSAAFQTLNLVLAAVIKKFGNNVSVTHDDIESVSKLSMLVETDENGIRIRVLTTEVAEHIMAGGSEVQ